MNKTPSLVKTLKILCLIGEIFAGLGLLVMVASIPFSESMVDGRRANVGLYVIDGSPEWSFYARMPHTHEGSVSYMTPALANEAGKLSPPNSELGDISVGPFAMHVDAYPAKSPDIKAESVVIDHIEGMVTFKRPTNAAQVLAPIKWPFVITLMCTGITGVAILELLRRMFRSVESGEIFSAANIRNVRTIGVLLVASSILKFIATAWLVNRMVTYVGQHVAGGVILEHTYQGNLSGLGTGLVIVALAEVFRQGLKLKEESQFTI